MIRTYLKKLCETVSVSGQENLIFETVKDLCPKNTNVSADKMGNIVISYGDENAERKILLDAHIDQIGFIVTDICENGFLRVSPVGGINPKTLYSTRVRVGKDKLFGVFSSVPPHLQSAGDDSKYDKISDLAIDIGYSKEEAEKLVSLGDRVCYDYTPEFLGEDSFCSGAIDDKGGCALMLDVISKIAVEKVKNISVKLVLSSQEELGMRGATAYSSACDATDIICTDASFAYTPGCPAGTTRDFAMGPMLGIAPILSSRMTNELKELAKERKIDIQYEVMSRKTGTNADVLSLVSGDTECALISFPIKNMHSPVEIVDIHDLEATSELICEYIRKAAK